MSVMIRKCAGEACCSSALAARNSFASVVDTFCTHVIPCCAANATSSLLLSTSGYWIKYAVPISKQIPGASSTQRIFLSVLFSVPCACIKNKSCESSALGGWEPRKGTCNNPRAFCNSAIASLNFASTLFFGAAFFFLKTSSSHAVCP